MHIRQPRNPSAATAHHAVDPRQSVLVQIRKTISDYKNAGGRFARWQKPCLTRWPESVREDEQSLSRRGRPFPHDGLVFPVKDETNRPAISSHVGSRLLSPDTCHLTFQFSGQTPPSVRRTRERLRFDTRPQPGRTRAGFSYRALVSQPNREVPYTPLPAECRQPIVGADHRAHAVGRIEDQHLSVRTRGNAIEPERPRVTTTPAFVGQLLERLHNGITPVAANAATPQKVQVNPPAKRVQQRFSQTSQRRVPKKRRGDKDRRARLPERRKQQRVMLLAAAKQVVLRQLYWPRAGRCHHPTLTVAVAPRSVSARVLHRPSECANARRHRRFPPLCLFNNHRLQPGLPSSRQSRERAGARVDIDRHPMRALTHHVYGTNPSHPLALAARQ